ncbi:hypothetical protein BHM03_00057853, partial [Ensete ventricosum]
EEEHGKRRRLDLGSKVVSRSLPSSMVITTLPTPRGRKQATPAALVLFPFLGSIK